MPVNIAVEIRPADQSRLFEGDSPGRARAAASEWLGDFSQHGPLRIRRITVSDNGETFIAIVTYSEMAPLN
jgi:hypothetical protein